MTIKAPKTVQTENWQGYKNPVWHKKDKKNVTILYNMIERRKSFFLRAYMERNGYNYVDLGDHVKEDVQFGREWGTRMQCNPIYFTAGAIIRNLLRIEKETGLSKEKIVNDYVFLGGGGQCGPCRYGMYPQEYMKVANSAGFKDFRFLIFNSDIIQDPPIPKEAAFQFDVGFKVNFMLSFILADFMHIAECALRPYAMDKEAALKTITQCEEMILETFKSKLYLFKLPGVLRKVGKILAAVPRKDIKLPQIFITGEIFANMAHNDGNYNLRRFIMDEGGEVLPGIFSQRGSYEGWRRIKEAERKIQYAASPKEKRYWQIYSFRQKISYNLVKKAYAWLEKAIDPKQFGGKSEMHDVAELAKIGDEHYNTLIFGGEGNIEIGEAIYYQDKIDGFVSVKPFGCMPSSGVSDGVQSKIIGMYPHLNFLSIETSGDNEVNILSRVSMMLFKAKQRMKEREMGVKPVVDASNLDIITTCRE